MNDKIIKIIIICATIIVIIICSIGISYGLKNKDYIKNNVEEGIK